MPHASGHVILKLTTPIDSDKPALKLWHCALLIFGIGVIVGALVLG